MCGTIFQMQKGEGAETSFWGRLNLLRRITRLEGKVNQTMASLQDVETSLNNLTTVVGTIGTDVKSALDGLATANQQIADLKQQLADGGAVTAADLDNLKTQIDAATAQLTQTDSNIESVLNPPAPAPAPSPEPAPAPAP